MDDRELVLMDFGFRKSDEWNEFRPNSPEGKLNESKQSMDILDKDGAFQVIDIPAESIAWQWNRPDELTSMNSLIRRQTPNSTLSYQTMDVSPQWQPSAGWNEKNGGKNLWKASAATYRENIISRWQRNAWQ